MLQKNASVGHKACGYHILKIQVCQLYTLVDIIIRKKGRPTKKACLFGRHPCNVFICIIVGKQ